MSVLPTFEVIQNAYVVNDIDQAIERMTRDAGLGPWMITRNLTLPQVFYRGKEAELEISVAFTQAADVQIELIQQINDGPSCYRDVYAPGEEGFHHTAMFVPDYEAAIKAYEDAGYPCAEYFVLPEGGSAAYMDTNPLLGHMVELYRDTQGIHDMYAAVRNLCDTVEDRRHVQDGDAVKILAV